MRLKIEGYEVEIKAKKIGKKRMNKRDTGDFLHVLAKVYVYASVYTEKLGFQSTADKLEDDFESIYYAEQTLKMELE